ncbi:MAG: polysaccharide biosynthesis tyrosine autokinase [Bacteroidota bacterium]
MEDIDVRIVIRKLIRKWYWFAISLFITLSLAALYLYVTAEEYAVATTIQLKDQSLGDKGTAQEKFLSGFELLESDAELEDEMGILTSYSTIRQSLENLGFEVSYYRYQPELKWVATKVGEEVYPAPFIIELDTTGMQLLYTPIHISFPDDQHYRITLEANGNPLWVQDMSTDQVVAQNTEIVLDTTLLNNQLLQLPYLNFSLKISNPAQLIDEDANYYLNLQSLGDLTDSYQRSLRVETISENSNIARLSISSPIPSKEIAFLNQLTEVYITNDLAKKNRLGERTIEFIDYQLASVADSLQDTEGSLEDFRAQNQVIDVGVTSQNLTEQLFTLEEKQAQLSVQNEYYKYMAKYLASNDNITDVVAPSSVGIQDELLNSLLIQLSNLNEEKVAKDYSSNPNNPVLRVVERKIQNTKQALIDNIDNLISSNNIALRENNRRVANIQQTMRELPQNERNLTDIERRFTFNDNIYNYLLQKRAEAGIAIASNVPDKTVIDVPRQLRKKADSPNKLFILLLALMTGFIVPAGLIFIKDFFKVKVESDEQLSVWTDIPVIERIARVKEKEKQLTYGSESYLAHTFRYIRHHVDFLRLSQEVKTVGITSAKSGEGKTFCALNLATSFASAGRKILLIDADLHYPMLAQKLNIGEQPGLSDYLFRAQQQANIISHSQNLDVLTAGTQQKNPSDLLTTAHLPQLLSSLKKEYDLLILDTPPVGMIADYLLLSKCIDYTLLLVRDGFSTKEEVQRLDRLVKRHALRTGILYNGVPLTEKYTGYYRKVRKGKGA